VDAEEASMIGARARKIRRPRAEPGGCGRLNRDRQAVPIDAGARSARFQPAPPARGPGGRSRLLGGRPHGQPYLPVDRETAAAMPAISEISLALHNATLDDVPDPRARPLPALVEAAARANLHRDNARYAIAGHGLGAVLTELHVWVVTGHGDDRQAALAALAEACLVWPTSWPGVPAARARHDGRRARLRSGSADRTSRLGRTDGDEPQRWTDGAGCPLARHLGLHRGSGRSLGIAWPNTR
jgi:hypothetical protein